MLVETGSSSFADAETFSWQAVCLPDDEWEAVKPAILGYRKLRRALKPNERKNGAISDLLLNLPVQPQPELLAMLDPDHHPQLAKLAGFVERRREVHPYLNRFPEDQKWD